MNKSIKKGYLASTVMILMTIICAVMVIVGLFTILFAGNGQLSPLIPIVLLFGIIPVLIWGSNYIFKKTPFAFTDNMRKWLDTKQFCPYRYAYDGTGIALDARNGAIHLIQKINNRYIEKNYAFDDIRCSTK